MKKILTVFVFVTILLSLSAEDFSVKTLNKLDKLLEKETKSLNHGGISFTLANDEDIVTIQHNPEKLSKALDSHRIKCYNLVHGSESKSAGSDSNR